ncbi:MAG: hypothetical protein IH851_00525 [Armatimonadetes bacterium]|nr:hypothetical protein [Armatimonadota bacterium]
MSRRLGYARVVVALVAIGMLTALVLFFVGLRDPPPDRAFSRSEWLSAANTEEAWRSIRRPMADDLIRNHLVPGMSKAGVTALLGEPSSVYSPADAGPEPANERESVAEQEVYEYHLGYYRWHAFSYDVLSIRFSKDGPLVGAEMVPHIE